MATNSEKYRQVCDEVWRDRANILTGRGDLSGEDVLVRAVYWRLCKTGDEPKHNNLTDIPFLKELVRQYRDETGQN